MSLFNEQSNIMKVNSYLQLKTNCRTGHKIQYTYHFLCIPVYPFSMTMSLSGKAQRAPDTDSAVQSHTLAHTPKPFTYSLTHIHPLTTQAVNQMRARDLFWEGLSPNTCIRRAVQIQSMKNVPKIQICIERLIKISSLPGQRLSLQLKRQLQFLIY